MITKLCLRNVWLTVHYTKHVSNAKMLHFPPHLISTSALPSKTENPEIVYFRKPLQVVEPTGQRACTATRSGRNSNETVAGAASQAFGRCLHRPNSPLKRPSARAYRHIGYIF